MATLNEFYHGEGDINLGKDIVLNSGTVTVQRVIAEEEGTYDVDTTTATITLPSGVISADDEFNSVGNNLEFLDDDGDVCQCPIDDTVLTGNTITVTVANAKKIGSGLAASLTDTSTYQFRILTPTVASDIFSGARGRYLGWITALSITPSVTNANITIGIPQENVAQGETVNGLTVEGTLSNIANKDVLSNVLGTTEFGTQPSGGYRLGWGGKNAKKPYMRIYITTEDESGKTMVYTLLRNKLSINGAWDFMATEFKSLAFNGESFKDGFYPAGCQKLLIARS